MEQLIVSVFSDYAEASSSSNETVNGTITNSTSAPQQQQQQQSGSTALQDALNTLIIVLLAIVMVGMGCAVHVDKLWSHLKRPTGILTGFIIQFGIMPLITYCFTLIFALNEYESIALLIQASCPGGSLSNVAAFWFLGDMDLSISMTSCSTVLALGMMPLLLYLYGLGYEESLPVPFESIGITCGTLLGPIAIGVFINYMWPKVAKYVLKICSIGGLIVCIGSGVVSIVLYNAPWILRPGLAASATLLPVIGLLIGWGVSTILVFLPCKNFNLKPKERRTISLESGIQNTSICGSVLLLSARQFPPQYLGSMFLVPILWACSQIVVVTLMILGFRLGVHYNKGIPSCCRDANEDDSNSSIVSMDDFDRKEQKRPSFYHNSVAAAAEPPPYDESLDDEEKSSDKAERL